DVQLAGQRLAQAERAQVGIGQVGQLVVVGVQLVEQGAAQQGLAGADLAGDLDEPLALVERHAQQVEAGLVWRQLHQIAGVRREREGLLAQTEERLVHPYLTSRKASALLCNSSIHTSSLTT